MQSIYLARDHPVIISDSHSVDTVPADFVDFLQTLPHLKFSIPCNTITNLFQIRNEQPNLKRLLEQTRKIGTKDWFVYFRNCEFEAVKSSRAIFPPKRRPYFMSNHLPPFHSSWYLISNQNNQKLNDKRLPVKDLVFVFQLRGNVAGRLGVQKKCALFCADQEFYLNAGETLIFNADMWDFFFYGRTFTSQSESLAVTFIQETRTD